MRGGGGGRGSRAALTELDAALLEGLGEVLELLEVGRVVAGLERARLVRVRVQRRVRRGARAARPRGHRGQESGGSVPRGGGAAPRAAAAACRRGSRLQLLQLLRRRLRHRLLHLRARSGGQCRAALCWVRWADGRGEGAGAHLRVQQQRVGAVLSHEQVLQLRQRAARAGRALQQDTCVSEGASGRRGGGGEATHEDGGGGGGQVRGVRGQGQGGGGGARGRGRPLVAAHFSLAARAAVYNYNKPNVKTLN